MDPRRDNEPEAYVTGSRNFRGNPSFDISSGLTERNTRGPINERKLHSKVFVVSLEVFLVIVLCGGVEAMAYYGEMRRLIDLKDVYISEWLKFGLTDEHINRAERFWTLMFNTTVWSVLKLVILFLGGVVLVNALSTISEWMFQSRGIRLIENIANGLLCIYVHWISVKPLLNGRRFVALSFLSVFSIPIIAAYFKTRKLALNMLILFYLALISEKADLYMTYSDHYPQRSQFDISRCLSDQTKGEVMAILEKHNFDIRKVKDAFDFKELPMTAKAYQDCFDATIVTSSDFIKSASTDEICASLSRELSRISKNDDLKEVTVQATAIAIRGILNITLFTSMKGMFGIPDAITLTIANEWCLKNLSNIILNIIFMHNQCYAADTYAASIGYKASMIGAILYGSDKYPENFERSKLTDLFYPKPCDKKRIVYLNAFV